MTRAHGSHTHPGPRADTEAAAGHLASELRSRGMRMTAQRKQVLAAVRALGHATPDEISESVEGVDPATVYRALEVLEELGFVKHTHLGHGAPSYRPAEDEHVHVVCHSCGRVTDTDPAVVDELADRLAHEQGFTLDRGHFTVFGRCRACTAGAEQSTATER